eukprot:TRINITY_DN36390_c0_g1_i2.p1 TRINITY_DN36390_c0_g1~~TRINITY_DN36390_c0_g1_i2.p1  ORF type:complete len:638 (-),score=107.95 TRINITY_DN36390_c0_g1_i2:262-2175(-)
MCLTFGTSNSISGFQISDIDKVFNIQTACSENMQDGAAKGSTTPPLAGAGATEMLAPGEVRDPQPRSGPGWFGRHARESAQLPSPWERASESTANRQSIERPSVAARMSAARVSLRNELRESLRESGIPDDRRSTRMSRFYRPPTFHMSILAPSGSEASDAGSDDPQRSERSSTYTELFFDLVYTVPLTNLVHVHLSQEGYYIWILQFIAVAISWQGEMFFNTRFDTDDAVVHLLTVGRVIAIVLIAYGIKYDDDIHLAAGYTIIRGILVLQYIRVICNTTSPKLRTLCAGYATGFGIAALIWIGALLATSVRRQRYAAFYVAVALDLATPLLMLHNLLPVHHTHLPERLANWAIVVITVLFTEYVNAVIQGDGGAKYHLLCLAVATVLPFSIMTLYTNVCNVPVGLDDFTSSLRHRLKTYLQVYLHIPFSGSIIYLAYALVHFRCGSHFSEDQEETYPTEVTLGLCLTFVLLGCLHHLTRASTYHRTVTRVGAGVVFLLVLIPNHDSVSNEWYLVIFAVLLTAQVLLEYLFFERYVHPNSSRGSELSSWLADSVPGMTGSSVDPEPLLDSFGSSASSVKYQVGESQDSLKQALEQISDLEYMMEVMKQEYEDMIRGQLLRIQELEASKGEHDVVLV